MSLASGLNGCSMSERLSSFLPDPNQRMFIRLHFLLAQHMHRGDTWAEDFGRTRHEAASTSDWVDEFSKLGVKDWADEFGDQMAKGSFNNESNSSWLDSYDK